jgi:hypothetical protein
LVLLRLYLKQHDAGALADALPERRLLLSEIAGLEIAAADGALRNRARASRASC